MFRMPRIALRPYHAGVIAALGAAAYPRRALCASEDQETGPAEGVAAEPIIKTTMFNGWKATLQTFQAPAVTVKFNLGPWGKTTPYTYNCLLLTPSEAEKKLTQEQQQLAFNRAGNPLWRLDINTLPSNTVMEDAHAFDIIPKARLPVLLEQGSFWERWHHLRTTVLGDFAGVQSKTGDGSKDLIMASVFDGHGGPQVSELAGKTLHACIARAMAKNEVEGKTKDLGTILAETCVTLSSPAEGSYQAFDDDLLKAPELLTTGELEGPANDLLPNPSPSLFSLRSIDGPGASAITAVMDIENGDLWVANLGDCRCVAGWYDTATDIWRCDILSRDMTADDPEEEAAVLAEHPNEDPNEVVFDRGYGRRVLGFCQPTRAFGDQNCKARTVAKNSHIRKVLGKPDNTGWLGKHVSPPYMITSPEITHRKIKSSNPSEKLKFIILGVDVFDRLTSEEATLLLAGHLSYPQHPEVSRADLPGQIKLAPPPEQRAWPQQPLPSSPERSEGTWHFQDLNAATHLTRNALAGFGDPEIRRLVLSLTGPGARQMRDDMTAMVLLFDDDGLAYTSKQM